MYVYVELPMLFDFRRVLYAEIEADRNARKRIRTLRLPFFCLSSFFVTPTDSQFSILLTSYV